MNRWKLFIVLTMAFVVSVACGFSGSSPTRTPTTAPVITENPPTQPPAVQPTLAAATEAPPSPSAPFEISSETYTHSSGAFSVNPPLGWKLDELAEGEAFFDSPDSKASLIIAVTNTGYQLDAASVNAFIDAREAYQFSTYEEFIETDRDDQLAAEGYMWVYKNLSLSGEMYYVATYYKQLGQAVFHVDNWIALDLPDAYAVKFDELLATLYMDGAAAASLPLYFWNYTFEDPNGLFSINVPVGWTYSYEISDEETVILDEFASPDGHASIMNIMYDGGDQINKSQAGQMALSLLNNYFTKGAGDIKVTGDQIVADGSERLDWNSKSMDYSGESFFETRGTTFLMFNMLYDDDWKNVYYDRLSEVVGSYDIP